MMKFIEALTTRHVLVVALAIASASAFGAAPTKCTDLPVSFAFLPTSPAAAAISNDIAGKAYQDGVDGISNTVIHRCGTNDATMLLRNSRRSVLMQFPAPIPGSIIAAGPPSFAGGAAFQSRAFFNVRNVLNSGAITSTSPATDFYTRMVIQFPAPDGNSYGLYFHPDDGSCPGDLPCAPDLDAPSLPAMNSPVEASWVKVHFMPATGTTNAKWLVDGEQFDTSSGSYERGTLFLHPNHGADTHEGQYAMPFQILITALGSL